MEHTPTPWKRIPWSGAMEIRTEDNSVTNIAILGRYEDGATPSKQAHDDAEFIVRAVNSHDELVEALKAAKKGLNGENPWWTNRKGTAKGARSGALAIV